MNRFWYPTDLETLGGAPTGVAAGPFVFLSAQVARDLETGRQIRRLWDLPDAEIARLTSGFEHEDGREGPIKAQTLVIYQNLQRILAARGLSLSDVIRQRIYLRNVRDIRAMQDVMLERFEAFELPATTISTMASRGVDKGMLVEIEVIAFDRRESELERRVISVDGLDKLTAPYPLAVAVGQLMFTSGMFGFDLQSGHLTRHVDELDEEMRSHLETGSYYRNASEEAYKAQIGTIHSHLKRLLASQGATFDHLVKENHLGPYGVTEANEGMHEWSSWHPLRLGLFPDVDTAPTTTSPQTPHVGPDLDARTMVDAVALLPGRWQRDGIEGESIKMGHLKMLNWAGPVVYITGYLGMDRELHGPIKRFDQLSGAARLAGLARIDDRESTQAQAWRTYGDIDGLLKEAGLGFDALTHQTVYMQDVAAYPVLEDVARSFGPIPATTVVGVQDAGPFPELEFEIDCTAFDPRRS